MDLFDKLFPKKENKIDKAFEDAYQSLVGNNPVTKKVKRMINETADQITGSLEEELYGSAKSLPGEHGDVIDNFEERRLEWDRMFDQIEEKELSQYKICEACGQMVPSDREICPYCDAKLPDHTAAVRICPHCGAKNRALNFYCTSCGKEMGPLVEEGEDK